MQLENKEKRNSSYSSYFAENVAGLRYQMIQKFDGDEHATKFVQDHLDFTAFRKMAIVSAMEHQQYDKALQLAEEGERHDTSKGYQGLVDQWNRYRYEIYQLTHQVEHQKKLAEEFLVSVSIPITCSFVLLIRIDLLSWMNCKKLSHEICSL